MTKCEKSKPVTNANGISVRWNVFPASCLEGKSSSTIFKVVKNSIQKSFQLSQLMKIKRVRSSSSTVIIPFPIIRYLLGLEVWLDAEMLLRKKLPPTIVLTNICANILLRNRKEEGLMVQLANGKQQNSEENYLLLHLKLTTKNMLKFMLSMRRAWITVSHAI